MKLRWLGGALALLLAAQIAPAAEPLQVTSVTLRTRHRVFGNFQEDRSVRPRQVFQVGDTDYTAQVIRFVPDFAMNMKSHKIITRTPEPNNPAFQILVKQNGVAKDTTWAFLDFAPHFTRNSLLAFQILRIDFKNHAPLIAPPDTAATAKAAPRAPAAGATGKK